MVVFSDEPASIGSLLKCIFDIKTWMEENLLQLNLKETEVLFIVNGVQTEKLAAYLQLLTMNPSKTVQNLGVIFDPDLSFSATCSKYN